MGPTTSEVLASAPRPLDPRQKQQAVELHIEGEIMRLMGLRVLSAQIAGLAPGPEAAIKKMLADRHGQKAMRFLRDSAAAQGILNGEPDSWGFLFSPALTIGGGTTQVLSNIIGESILGLPRD
jgi:alkylation response protein AidB-like acyl-CoA dehydrogenase